MNARTVAVKVIADIERNKSYSNIVVDVALNGADLSRQDSAFASMLVYGVLQRKLTLDSVIACASGRTLNKTHPFVLAALRVGVFQVLFSKVPLSAAVNETVKIVKSSKQSFASGFVNAVMRKISSTKDAILLEIENSKDLQYKYSCNESFCQSLINDYGLEFAEGYLKAALKTPSLYAVVNTFVTDEDKLFGSFDNECIEYKKGTVSNSFVLEGVGNIENLKQFKDGAFFVQDLASQIALSEFMIESGMSFLDVCSAPGGKSFTAAQYLGRNGRIVACDLYEKRVGLVVSGAKRLKLDILNGSQNDATVFNSQLGTFDRVLCDVPCSGWGVIRRKPEIKYKDPSEFSELPDIQLKILKTSAKYLKEDGLLMYSTCTLRNIENRGVIDLFLTYNHDFEILKESTLFTQKTGSDGFYYCILKRSSHG